MVRWIARLLKLSLNNLPMNACGSFFSYQSFVQLVRYGVVGIAQNSVGYGIYLLFTWLGFDPKLVVAVCYPCAMLVSFLGNKKFTFNFTGGWQGSGVRFILAHAVSYAINLGMIYILTDKMGYPHQLVQAAAIFVCAGFLFVALKFFVFPPGKNES